MIVINALKESSPSIASYGLLIWDISLFAEHFHCINFSHVCRDRNSVAHNLVRHARHVIDSLVCVQEIPPQVSTIYLADWASLTQ